MKLPLYGCFRDSLSVCVRGHPCACVGFNHCQLPAPRHVLYQPPAQLLFAEGLDGVEHDAGVLATGRTARVPAVSGQGMKSRFSTGLGEI